MNPSEQTARERAKRMGCGECGQNVELGAFHPFLYCQLYKLGYHDQEKTLWSYGFTRRPDGGFG